MIVSMIMAMDRNGLIGAEGGMPWHLPSELKYFKSVTMGKPIIMGRKTFDSIGNALPGRTNIVVTRQSDWAAECVIKTGGLVEALAEAENHLDETCEAMIIGGASLCREAMPYTQKLYLTEIDHVFEGDVWLDSYNEQDWNELSSRQVLAEGSTPYAYRCRVLERSKKENPTRC